MVVISCTESTITDIGIITAHMEWMKFPIKAISPQIRFLLDSAIDELFG
jgi:hypothetical protein